MSRASGPLGPARAKRISLIGLALGATLALITSAQPWWIADAGDAQVALTGSEVTAGLSQAVGLVALAGLCLGLTLRGGGRVVLGVLLAVAGGGIVGIGISRFEPGDEAIRARLTQVSLSTDAALSPTPWPYGYLLAGLIVLTAAVLIVLTGARWPTRADRFRRESSEQVRVASVDPNDPAQAWQALDAGVDPTDSATPTASERLPDAAEDRRD